jgi:ADP-ribose pyrophosphatase YjhB (NUDIX family)
VIDPHRSRIRYPYDGPVTTPAETSLRQTRRIGAYGVIGDGSGRVLLTRSSDLSDVVGTWYLPGGGVEHGEDPARTVVREVAEETGLAVEITGLRGATADVLPLAHRGELLHTDRVLYDLRVVGGALRAETGGTTDVARWLTLEQAAALPLMPFVAEVLGLPAAAPRVRPDLPPGERPPVPLAPDALPRGQRFAAYGLVTDPAGRVLLTEVAAGYPSAGRWHLPGGGTDHGEQPAAGVLREVYEESGQRGRVVELIGASGRHNPRALGPEGYPMDWHSVRVVYRIAVDEPTPARVLDVGGSTVRSQWFDRAEIAALPVTDVVDWALSV